MRKPQLLLVALILAQPQAGTRLVRGCKLQTNRIHGSLRLEAGMANASMFIISLIYVALSQAPGRWFKTWPALRNLRWRAAAAAFFLFYQGAICKAPLRIKKGSMAAWCDL